MPEQDKLDLRGRAPDPVIEEVKAHPDRIVRFRFVEFVGYLKGELLDVDTGESLGTTTPLSKSVLAASRRTS